MGDKNLSGEEKRQLMKEEFKKDLKLRKEFLDKVKEVRQQKKVLDALDKMKHEDDTDDLIRTLNEETALTDAKMEMAMDAIASEKQVDMDFTEEEMRKISAQAMVEKMKEEIFRGLVREIPIEDGDAILTTEKKTEKSLGDDEDDETPGSKEDQGGVKKTMGD